MNNFLAKIKNLLNDKQKQAFVSFMNKYKQYFAAIGLFAVMIVILIFFTGEEVIAKRLAKINSQTVSGEEYVPDKEFEVNAYPEVNSLIEEYFYAYVNADFAMLDSLATPVSAMEKSYIAIMSQYYEEFTNVTCYTKHGLSRDSYIVSACFDIKFYNQEVLAPSMVLFYVQTGEDGKLYINNLYSDFNMKYSENDVDADVYTALRKYITQEDYLALYKEVEAEFNELVKTNAEIQQLTKRTIPVVRQEWEDAVYFAQDDVTEGTQSTEGALPTEGTQSTEATQTTESTQSTEATQTTETTQTPEPEPEPEPEPVVVKVRTTTGVNVRPTPDTSGDPVGAAEEGEIFVKLGEENGWTKIQFDEDTIGYIKNSFVEEVTE